MYGVCFFFFLFRIHLIDNRPHNQLIFPLFKATVILKWPINEMKIHRWVGHIIFSFLIHCCCVRGYQVFGWCDKKQKEKKNTTFVYRKSSRAEIVVFNCPAQRRDNIFDPCQWLRCFPIVNTFLWHWRDLIILSFA